MNILSNMSREEYIKLRENNSIELLYEYYREKVDKNKYKELDPTTFYSSIVQWPPVNDAYKAIIAYYDAKFTIMKVEDLGTGNIIKVY